MKPGDIQVRRDICKSCKRECSVRATIDHTDPCAGCPQRVYHIHSACGSPTPDEPIRGLGDLLHVVALPIARALRLPCIDPATKKLRPESPCAARRKKLNDAVPFT